MIEQYDLTRAPVLRREKASATRGDNSQSKKAVSKFLKAVSLILLILNQLKIADNVSSNAFDKSHFCRLFSFESIGNH